MEKDKLLAVHFLASCILIFSLALSGQSGDTRDGDALVKKALANEVNAARDPQHLMRYRLRKSSPRLTSTKEILETADGAVARLVAINDSPLSPIDEQKEQARLASLLSDPGKQRHRKQNEDQDTARALKVLRALPSAYKYQFAGTSTGPAGEIARFTFTPNPHFNPPDLETQVLAHMVGVITINVTRERVAKLEAHLQEDVDFGWGILGRLNKGGWIVIELADVGEHQWRIVHFQMSMTGRVVFKTKSFDTTEDQSDFAGLPADLHYQQAVRMLQSKSATPGQAASAAAIR
jgi:hypothetical protein